MSKRRVYVPTRYVAGSVVLAVEDFSVDVWTVQAAFAGRPRVCTKWFLLACSGPEATAIAKALVALLDAQATDPVNIGPVLRALSFSGPCIDGHACFSEPPEHVS